MRKKLTSEEWIKKARLVHGDNYDYSKVDYNGNKAKVCIICSEHGEFWQRSNNHSRGVGCPKCNDKKKSDRYKLSIKEFIEKARLVHGDKYDYSKVDYENNHIKVCIICSEHEEFWQRPQDHLQGNGCPKCNRKKLEFEIYTYLTENNITFEEQYRPPFLKTKTSYQSLDFFLPDHNIGIECQGIQHFIPVGYFGGEKVLKKTIECDKRKFDLCKENGIIILYYANEADYIPEEYFGGKIFTNIDEIFKQILTSSIICF